MKMKTSALALMAAMMLAGCTAQSAHQAKNDAHVQKPAAAETAVNVQKRELASGRYEMALSPKGEAL